MVNGLLVVLVARGSTANGLPDRLAPPTPLLVDLGSTANGFLEQEQLVDLGSTANGFLEQEQLVDLGSMANGFLELVDLIMFLDLPLLLGLLLRGLLPLLLSLLPGTNPSVVELK